MREWVKFIICYQISLEFKLQRLNLLSLTQYSCQLLFENVIPDPKQFAESTNKFQSEHVKTWDSMKDEQIEVEHRVKRI